MIEFDQEDFDEKLALALTEVERLRRLATLGDWTTAGPVELGDAIEVVPPPAPRWRDGWYDFARSRPAHPKRIGRPIVPFAITVHTCDMLHEEFFALIDAFSKRPGEGNAAHFIIGPTPHEAVVQLAPINRNANHAGGPDHGNLVDARGRRYHPNLATVGIEFHNAGGVRLVGGQWRLVERGKAHGAAIHASEVTPDPKRPGRGWHKLTDYQRERYVELRAELESQLAPAPAGLRSVSRSGPAPSWATMVGRVAFHAGLDSARRADPWPPIAAWVRDHERSLGL